MNLARLVARLLPERRDLHRALGGGAAGGRAVQIVRKGGSSLSRCGSGSAREHRAFRSALAARPALRERLSRGVDYGVLPLP